MFENVIMIFLVFVGVLLIALNTYASKRILKSTVDEPDRKFAQICFVWLLPILGAVLTIQIHRKLGPKGKPEGYPKDKDDILK